MSIEEIKKEIINRGYIGYEETLLSSLEKAQIYIEQLRGALGYAVSGDIRENPEIKNGLADALFRQVNELKVQLENEKQSHRIWKEQYNKLEPQAEKWEEELEKARVIISDAKCLAYNLTPVRTKDDVKEDLCEQIQLMHDMSEGAIIGWRVVEKTLKERVDKAEGELKELKSAMGSDQQLSELLYEYHMRAEKAEERVKGLEEIVVVQNDTIVESETRINEAEAELRKWTAPHSGEDLQEAKKQSQHASYSGQPLAAKQVYINGLEKRVKELETKLAEIKNDPSKGKLIVEVSGDEEME